MNRSTDALCSIIPKTHFCSLSEWTPQLWEVRLHRGHLCYIQRCGFLKDVKNCTVCIKLYWLQIKMSWKPPSSDSKEGQLKFSPKCIKFSTKCYTNNIYFFPLYIFLLKSKTATIKRRQETSVEKLYTDWQTHRQHKDTTDTITSFPQGKIFFFYFQHSHINFKSCK